MSGPTKGMVAGQPIQTGAQTKEFDEGYERTFGERKKPQRGRWVWSAEEGCLVQVGGDWEPTEPKQPLRVDVSYMDGLRTSDGVDISSKAKRREYMHRKGLADSSDFTEHWQKAAKERERALSGESTSKERKEILGRELYKARAEARKKR